MFLLQPFSSSFVYSNAVFRAANAEVCLLAWKRQFSYLNNFVGKYNWSWIIFRTKRQNEIWYFKSANGDGLRIPIKVKSHDVLDVQVKYLVKIIHAMLMYYNFSEICETWPCIGRRYISFTTRILIFLDMMRTTVHIHESCNVYNYIHYKHAFSNRTKTRSVDKMAVGQIRFEVYFILKKNWRFGFLLCWLWNE